MSNAYISVTIWKWFTSLIIQWLYSMPEKVSLLCLGTEPTKKTLLCSLQAVQQNKDVKSEYASRFYPQKSFLGSELSLSALGQFINR